MWNSNKIVGNILGKKIGRDTRSRNDTNKERSIALRWINNNSPRRIAQYLKNEHRLSYKSDLEAAWYWIEEHISDQPYDRVFFDNDGEVNEKVLMNILKIEYAKKYGR